MNKYFLIFFFLLFISCSNKPKSIYICGDHECVNKAEAKKYFEENLTLEVKIINDIKKKQASLVELNLKKVDSKKKIKITKKNELNKKLKILTKKEINEIKSSIKKKDKISKKLHNTNKNKDINNESKNDKKTNNKNKITVTDDICNIIEKCNIEEISKYLINLGKNKKFPDITVRQ